MVLPAQACSFLRAGPGLASCRATQDVALVDRCRPPRAGRLAPPFGNDLAESQRQTEATAWGRYDDNQLRYAAIMTYAANELVSRVAWKHPTCASAVSAVPCCQHMRERACFPSSVLRSPDHDTHGRDVESWRAAGRGAGNRGFQVDAAMMPHRRRLLPPAGRRSCARARRNRRAGRWWTPLESPHSRRPALVTKGMRRGRRRRVGAVLCLVLVVAGLARVSRSRSSSCRQHGIGQRRAKKPHLPMALLSLLGGLESLGRRSAGWCCAQRGRRASRSGKKEKQGRKRGVRKRRGLLWIGRPVGHQAERGRGDLGTSNARGKLGFLPLRTYY